MEIAAIIASIVSVILGGGAIAISVYFFVQAKSTETETAQLLTSIKTQTETLQTLTGRWLDRLTRAVTEPRPLDEAVIAIIQRITPGTVAGELPAPGSTSQALTQEVISAYLAVYYYIVLFNLAAQAYLPPLEKLEADNWVKQMVDSSYNDFQYMDRIISGLDQRLVLGSSLHHLYLSAVQLKHLMRDATMCYRDAVQEEGVAREPPPKET